MKASSATFHSGGLNDGMDLLLNKMDLGIPPNVKSDINTMLDDLREGRARETGLTGYVEIPGIKSVIQLESMEKASKIFHSAVSSSHQFQFQKAL